MANTRTYLEVTSSVLTCVRQWLAKSHVELPTGDSGDFKVQQGALATIEFHFDRDTETDELTLEITNRSDYVSEGNVWKVFDSGITDCGGRTP